MKLSVYNDEFFMKQAVLEAQKAAEVGEIPVGAVMVLKDRIITRAYNQTESLTDCTAHAEIMAIAAACQYLNSKYLTECTLFVTLEPCPMCAAALRWAQIKRLVYAAEDPKSGYMRFGSEMLHPKTQVAFGLMESESRRIIHNFFKSLRIK